MMTPILRERPIYRSNTPPNLCNSSGACGEVGISDRAAPRLAPTINLSGLTMLVPKVDVSGLPLLQGISRTLLARQTERILFILGVLLANFAHFAGRDEFCPLKFKMLGRFVRPAYLKRILLGMIRAGLIETDGVYVPKKKSRGYRLRPATMLRPLIEVPLSEPMARLINCYAPAAKVIRPPTAPEHQILWHNLQQLRADPTAWAFLRYGPALRPSALAQRTFTLQMIEWHAWTFSVSAATGRVFNNFTSVAADLRPFLRLGHYDDGLAEVDISASQPYILASLYPKDSQERLRYLALVVSGQFYEELGSQCFKKFRTRNALKVAMMVEVLFGRPEHGRKLWAAFQRMFPELATIMVGYKKGNGSKMALFLQNTEAGIMIGRVVPCLHQALSGRPFLTLHDAIVCLPSDAGVVSQIISQEFAKSLGTAPAVKIKSAGCHPQSQAA